MATFGEKLEVKVNIPNTKIEKDYEVDCKTLIDTYINAKFEDIMHVDGFTVTLKPISYKNLKPIKTRLTNWTMICGKS